MSETATICLGYLRLDRPGDVTPDCAECANECAAGVWLAVMDDGTWYGPLCDVCATSA